MFLVLKVTAVADHLRGYLSRFLVEYGTGIYVGNVSKRVADSLWTKAVEAADSGELVMVLSDARTEQGFSVRLHQTERLEVVNFDGYQLLAYIPAGAYGENRASGIENT